MNGNFSLVLPRHRVSGRLEIGFAARSDVHARAFGREAMRAGKANAFRPSGNQYLFAAKFQIHDDSSLVTLVSDALYYRPAGEGASGREGE